MFSKSPTSFNDVSSASKSYKGASGIFKQPRSPTGSALGAGSLSDQRSLSANSSQIYDKRSSSLLTFGEFNQLCNSIAQKKYAHEKYAKLVSVPSLYRKCCEQILQGLTLGSQSAHQDKKKWMPKLEAFVDREFKLQIQSYKIQFNDFDETPNGEDGSTSQRR